MFRPEDLHYRPAREADLAALLEFLPLLLQGNWSYSVLLQLLPAHQLRVLENSNGDIVGFAEYSLVLDESELLSLAVHPRWQGQGAGSLLLAAVSGEAASQGAVKMFLEVRESNAVARALYERHGFHQSGLRRGYYAPVATGAEREDACLYSLEFESSSSRD